MMYLNTKKKKENHASHIYNEKKSTKLPWNTKTTYSNRPNFYDKHDKIQTNQTN